MIFSDFTYNSITFKRFVRTSGYQAELVSGDQVSIRSTRDNLPGEDGIQRYLDTYGSRLVQISGNIKGSSEADLYERANQLRKAFDVTLLEQAGNYGFSPLVWQDPGQPQTKYNLKPLNRTLTITEDRTGLARRFSVLLEAKDPIKYLANSLTETVTITSSGGSSTFAFGFPVLFSATTGFAQVTITNSGPYAVYPDLIVLHGPPSGVWSGPRVSNITSGDFISFGAAITLTSGSRIEVIPANGSAKLFPATGGEQDIKSAISPDSNFFKLGAGASIVRAEGLSVSPGSYATITVTPSA